MLRLLTAGIGTFETSSDVRFCAALGGVADIKRADPSPRFPQIVEAMRSLPVQSCVIDGEAIVTNDKGLAVFDLLREHRHGVGAEFSALT